MLSSRMAATGSSTPRSAGLTIPLQWRRHFAAFPVSWSTVCSSGSRTWPFWPGRTAFRSLNVLISLIFYIYEPQELSLYETFMQALRRAVCPAAVVVTLIAFGSGRSCPAEAVGGRDAGRQAADQGHQRDGRVRSADRRRGRAGKAAVAPAEPGLGKDLNEVAAKLRSELKPRFSQVTDEVALLYAQTFTEQELKEHSGVL